MINKQISIIVAMLFHSILCCAQKAYGDFIMPEYDLEFIVPDIFNKNIDITSFEYKLSVNPDYMPNDALSEDERVMDMPSLLLSNDDGGALLFYAVPDRINPMVYKSWIMREIQVSLGDETVDVSDSIKVVAGGDMSAYSNADSVFIYRLTLPERYLGKYKYCVGVQLYKYAHPAMRMRVLMTDESLGNSDEYVKALLGSVRYGDAVPESGVLREKNWLEMREHIAKGGSKTRR